MLKSPKDKMQRLTRNKSGEEIDEDELRWRRRQYIRRRWNQIKRRRREEDENGV